MKIYAVKVDSPIGEEAFEFMISCLPEAFQTRILRQKIKQRADNMLVGNILSRVAVKKETGMEISRQKHLKNQYGKPFVSNCPGVYFNVSHSGEYVICAVSDKPVGVDIQKIMPSKPELIRRVCSDDEFIKIKKSEHPDSEFIRIWSCKEARVKMLGTGLTCKELKNINTDGCMSFRLDNYWVSLKESI